MAPISEARKKANEKYIKSQDELKIRTTKGKKEEIRNHAAAKGESVNSFVNRAIDETIARDNGQKDGE